MYPLMTLFALQVFVFSMTTNKLNFKSSTAVVEVAPTPQQSKTCNTFLYLHVLLPHFIIKFVVNDFFLLKAPMRPRQMKRCG